MFENLLHLEVPALSREITRWEWLVHVCNLQEMKKRITSKFWFRRPKKMVFTAFLWLNENLKLQSWLNKQTIIWKFTVLKMVVVIDITNIYKEQKIHLVHLFVIEFFDQNIWAVIWSLICSVNSKWFHPRILVSITFVICRSFGCEKWDIFYNNHHHLFVSFFPKK